MLKFRDMDERCRWRRRVIGSLSMLPLWSLKEAIEEADEYIRRRRREGR